MCIYSVRDASDSDQKLRHVDSRSQQITPVANFQPPKIQGLRLFCFLNCLIRLIILERIISHMMLTVGV